MLNTILTVLFVILFIAAILLLVLYFVGRKLEQRQVEQKEMMEAAAQTVSMLIIDKKKLKLKEAGLPKIVEEQTPKYMRWAKLPIVKAKIGPRIMTLIADEKVFLQLPVKAEVKVVLSGIYITELKSVRGGSPLPLPQKKGILSRFTKKKADTASDKNSKTAKNNTTKNSSNKTNTAKNSTDSKTTTKKSNSKKK